MLFIVLMTVIIIMIISVSILSQSMNEINFTQQQIDEIATDQLTKGVFWNAYAYSSVATGMQNIGVPTTNVQGRDYVVTLNSLGTASGVTSYNVVANYDSFQ